MNIEIKNILKKLTPFPILIKEQEVIEGNLFIRPHICQNCSHKECAQTNFSKNYCSNGFRIAELNIPNEHLKFIGIITTLSKHALPASLQKKYLSKTLDEKLFNNWASQLKESIANLKRVIDNKQQEYIDGFHDITPTINLIIRNAETLINKSDGKSLEDKFEHSQPEVQTLYKSAELLNQHLLFMSCLTNPDSITYGKKSPRTIYKLLDKMCKIFKQDAAVKHINLKIEGNSYNSPYIYDSLGILMFILLENAVKYSYDSQEVIITISDTADGGVSLDFMSYGPIVPPEEQKKIFNKYYRYIHSSLDSDKLRGHGLGLYIASLIARSHGFSIRYQAINTTSQKNGADIGENHFIFNIPCNLTE